MVLTSFAELEALVKGGSETRVMAVAVAADAHTLEAAMEARREGLVRPVLVGDRAKILSILADMGETVPDADVYDEPEEVAACEKAVALVREGRADFLMKGKVDTKVILKAVVNKERGLGVPGAIMSHVTLFEVPAYHKILAPVDGGMVTYPTLEQKKGIIENTVGVLHKLGYTCPKVGILACAEKPNPKMPETLDAQALAEMNKNGEITGCIVDGPISFDCAIDKSIADFKGYESPIAGDCDVLLAPNIHAGNIMGKMLVCFSGAKMAGFIAGARCPIVLTSRGSSAEEKRMSIVLAAAASRPEA